MSTKIMPISDLRRKTSQVLKILQEEGEDVYVTHYGRPVAVMVDYERYEELLARVEVLSERLRRRKATAEPIEDHTARLAGLHREVWDGVDTDAYVREEREAWEDSPKR
jgi:prevent-host-death family protein